MKKREKIWKGVLSDVTNMDVGPGVSVYTWQCLIWRGVLSDVTNMDVGPGVSVYIANA